MRTLDVDRYLARIAYEGEDRSDGAGPGRAAGRAHDRGAVREQLRVSGRCRCGPVSTGRCPRWSNSGGAGGVSSSTGPSVRCSANSVSRFATVRPGVERQGGHARPGAGPSVSAGHEAMASVGLPTSGLETLRSRHCDRRGSDAGPPAPGLPAGAARDRADPLPRSGTRSGGWELQYVVDRTPGRCAEFQGRSDALADPALGSPFTAKPFATRALAADGSRVWLGKDRLRLRAADGSISEEPVAEGSLGRGAAPVVRVPQTLISGPPGPAPTGRPSSSPA